MQPFFWGGYEALILKPVESSEGCFEDERE